jgi:hypothetical protein
MDEVLRDCALADSEEIKLNEKLEFRIVGVAPLIMHNGRLADPMDGYSRAIKEISAKRKKVDADFEEMARLEWMGSLYLVSGRPCIPDYVLEAALTGRGGAARSQKMGKEAAAGLFVMKSSVLEYDGPKEPDELWKDERFRLVRRVRIGQSSVIRTRPIFYEWSANIEVEFNPDFLNADHIRQWMVIAGERVGLMDWRPKCGRFTVEELMGRGT